MTEIATEMFNCVQKGIKDRKEDFISEYMDYLAQQEDYADQMQEQLSNFLVKVSTLPMSETLQNNVSLMLHIVDDIENMTDDCYSVALLIKRSIEKDMTFEEKELERIGPYMDLVHICLDFVKANINKPLSSEKLAQAEDIENQIDAYRKQLKKIARKNLEKGSNVKTELLYLDLIRHIEKIGDHAFSISESLSQTK